MTVSLEILLVEDDEEDALYCRQMLDHAPGLRCRVARATTLEEAIAHLDRHSVDAALVDLSLPDAEGVSSVVTLANRFPSLAVVVLTGLDDSLGAIDTLQAGAEDYLRKGEVDADTMARSIRYALQRKQVEQTLRAKDAAEAASRAKSQFLARMSHELRTPLTSVLGLAQLLEGECTGDQRELAVHIVRGASHLATMVDQLVDIARIEAGQLDFGIERVGLREAVAESLGQVGPAAAERAVALEPDLESMDRVWVAADRHRLHQVLRHLLTNAINYNRRGGRIEVRSDRRPGGLVLLEVRDNGPGIAADRQSRLFTPFDRLGAESTDIRGTGLGLVIARHLAEGMGGRLWLESAAGAGTTAFLELRAADAPTGVPAGATLSGSVLYIESRPASDRPVQAILTHRPGVRLTTIQTAARGIQLAAERQPDLILLHLRTPDMTGEGALRRLRADPATGDLPVVVVAGPDDEALRERLIELGADGFLTEPVDLADLLQILDLALANSMVPATG